MVMENKIPLGNGPWEEWRQWQFGELSNLLEYVWLNSPFYRASFGEAGITKPNDIQSWGDFSGRVPFNSKETIIDDQHKNPPYGTLLAVEPSALRYIFCYGGLEFIVYDEADFEEGSHLTIPGIGIQETDIVNITTSFHWVAAGLAMFFNSRNKGAAILPTGPGQTELQVRVMQLTKATVLIGFPSFIEHIADEAIRMGLNPRTDFSIRLAIVFGEMWSAATRRKIEETFDMDTVQSYGVMETGQVASECTFKNGMHLDPRVILEIIDPDTGQPLPPGSSGEIVVTSLKKKCQPIIRFRTRDITAGLDFSPCPCGSSLPRIGNIVGRTGDILRVRGLWVTPKQIQEVISGHRELGRFQAIVDRPGAQDVLTVKVEQNQPCDVSAIKKTLKQELKAKINLSCKIELVSPGDIAETAEVAVDRRKLDV